MSEVRVTMERPIVRRAARARPWILVLIAACPVTIAGERGVPSVSARLQSCDASTVRAAADEVLADPATLEEPSSLIVAAIGAHGAGDRERAAFLYLAGRLRTSRKLVFDARHDAGASALMGLAAGAIMPGVVVDPDLARRVVQRVLDWDRATPDPVRSRTQPSTTQQAAELRSIEAALRKVAEPIRDPERMNEMRERAADNEGTRRAMRAQRCSTGKLDAVEVEQLDMQMRTEAERLVRSHSLVLGRAGGTPKSVFVASSFAFEHSGKPRRLTVMVSSKAGKNFYAEVNAGFTRTPDGRPGPLKISLVCITDLWVGERDPSSDDVCVTDPKALRPRNAPSG